MLTRQRLRNWLVALGWIATFLAVMPYAHHRMGGVRDSDEAEFLRDHPDLHPSHSEYRFGWTDSPLVRYVREQSVEVHDSSGFGFKRTANLDIGWLSWSSLTLVIGLVLLRSARWLKPSTPAPVS